jgi:hypothetical protein
VGLFYGVVDLFLWDYEDDYLSEDLQATIAFIMSL